MWIQTRGRDTTDQQTLPSLGVPPRGCADFGDDSHKAENIQGVDRRSQGHAFEPAGPGGATEDSTEGGPATGSDDQSLGQGFKIEIPGFRSARRSSTDTVVPGQLR